MSGLSEKEFARRASDLALILCDVDGVLTDGSLYYDRRGHEGLRFNVRDGLGLKLAQRAGLRTAVLSGRSSAALDHRAQELGLDIVLSGIKDKAAALQELIDRQGITARQIAFIGDERSATERLATAAPLR